MSIFAFASVGETGYDPDIAVTGSSNEQWGLFGENGIHIEDAWKITTGSKKVRVAVIDTGVYDHKDLTANLVKGYNFVRNSTDTSDIHGHGTHVAGIIGAVGEVFGVCKDIEIVPLKIADSSSWNTNYVIWAFDYATRTYGTADQIDIINFSGWNFPNDIYLYQAIDNFPGLVVGIAGNGGKNIDVSPNYPGSFNIDNLITVGSIGEQGTISNFSNYGQDSVDIFAPGEDIYSTLHSNRYGKNSGTSMAAPHVAGVAALMLSINPKLTAKQLKDYILNSADKITITAGGTQQQVKKLNAYNSVKYTSDKMIPKTETFAADNFVDFGTLYNTGEYADWTVPVGGLTAQMGIIGYYLNFYFASCNLYELFDWEILSYTMYINVNVPTGSCWLLDKDKNFKERYYVENGVLTIPLTDIYNSGELIFYLYPEEEWQETIEFYLSDITIEITYIDY